MAVTIVGRYMPHWGMAKSTDLPCKIYLVGCMKSNKATITLPNSTFKYSECQSDAEYENSKKRKYTNTVPPGVMYKKKTKRMVGIWDFNPLNH